MIDSNELNVIKEALVEIMKSTCIEFVPRSSESDYVVFMQYKHPDPRGSNIIIFVFFLSITYLKSFQ